MWGGRIPSCSGSSLPVFQHYWGTHTCGVKTKTLGKEVLITRLNGEPPPSVSLGLVTCTAVHYINLKP